MSIRWMLKRRAHILNRRLFKYFLGLLPCRCLFAREWERERKRLWATHVTSYENDAGAGQCVVSLSNSSNSKLHAVSAHCVQSQWTNGDRSTRHTHSSAQHSTTDCPLLFCLAITISLFHIALCYLVYERRQERIFRHLFKRRVYSVSVLLRAENDGDAGDETNA